MIINNEKEIVDDEKVSLCILEKSNLSWDETQLIECIRTHPEEKEKLFQQITNK